MDNKLVKELEKRLFFIVRSWNQSLENYNNLDNFLCELNNTIQALRNITWILQSNKHNISNFDEWYAQKQAGMKNNLGLTWLVGARNQIVKQKNLELNSIARTSVTNWLNKPLFIKKYNPVLSNDEILNDVLSILSDIEKEEIVNSGRESILSIHRKWIVEGGPVKDVLMILSENYIELRKIVVEAVQLMGYQDSIHISEEQNILNSVIPREKQVMDYSLKDHCSISLGSITIPEKQINLLCVEAEKKYSLSGLGKIKKNDPNLILSVLTEYAKNIISIDGHHIPIAFCFARDKVFSIVLSFSDQTTKYLSLYKLSEIIKSEGCISVAIILESVAYFTVEDWQNKSKGQDILSITFLSNEGVYISHTIPFKILDKKMIFEDVIVSHDISSAQWLNPIKDVYGIK